MRDIHRKNPQTAFADFEEKDRFLDRFQAYVHRDWIGRVCRNSREEFDAFADRHPPVSYTHLLDQTAGDAGDRGLDGHAGVHEGQGGAADGALGGGAVGGDHLLSLIHI